MKLASFTVFLFLALLASTVSFALGSVPKLVLCQRDTYGQPTFPSLPTNAQGCFIAPPGITVVPAIIWTGDAISDVKMQLSVIQYADYINNRLDSPNPGNITSWDTNNAGKFLFFGVAYLEPTTSFSMRTIWNLSAQLITMADGGLAFYDGFGVLLQNKDNNITADYGLPIKACAVGTNEPISIVVKDGGTFTGLQTILNLAPGTYTLYIRATDGRVGQQYRLTVNQRH